MEVEKTACAKVLAHGRAWMFKKQSRLFGWSSEGRRRGEENEAGGLGRGQVTLCSGKRPW